MGFIFVFGSNLTGRHGKGAAKYAVEHHAAVYGQGIGLQGTSYAIPTKDAKLHSLHLDEIKKHVDDFIDFAWQNPQLFFFITAVGTGLAGYKMEDIAPMFATVPDNCQLPMDWLLWNQ